MRILILEDSSSDADLILDSLRELQPFESAVVSTERAFLHALDEHWDVILSDYNLPAFNALSAISSLLFRGLPTPLIIVTGSLGSEAAESCMRMGAAGFVLKRNLALLPGVVTQALKEWQLR